VVPDEDVPAPAPDQVVEPASCRARRSGRSAATGFSNELREQVDLKELTGHFLRVVEETMQPEDMSLWLRPVADQSSA
jgi:hypothetical protein